MATAAVAPEQRVATQLEQSPIVSRVYARVGLLGNPSDGFFGKTISFSLANYHAQVRGAEEWLAGSPRKAGHAQRAAVPDPRR